LRQDLSDVIHCHVAEHNGDHTPRVAVIDADENEWFVRSEKIGPDTARKLRAKWNALR
jgi:hypothetical protein